MWEINEAAKVITESIDREAKVIFGAVYDETLKKGEVKITVIATGFSELSLMRDDIASISSEGTGEEKRSPIWGSRAVEASSTQIPIRENGDEWDAPAFLRRKGK